MSLFSTTPEETTEAQSLNPETVFNMRNAAQWEYYTAAAKYTRSKHIALGVFLLLALYAFYKLYKLQP